MSEQNPDCYVDHELTKQLNPGCLLLVCGVVGGRIDLEYVYHICLTFMHMGRYNNIVL